MKQEPANQVYRFDQNPSVERSVCVKKLAVRRMVSGVMSCSAERDKSKVCPPFRCR